MAVEILQPTIGFSMNEGLSGFSLESDASTNEVEASASRALRITAQVGETYEVGTVLEYTE